MMENGILSRCLPHWLRNGFVPSKTVFFIWGLVFSYALVKKAVLDVLVEFLEVDGLSEWEVIVLTTMLDWITAVFKVGLIHISEAYTAGRFRVIIFCNGAYVMGLMLFWVRALSDLSTLIFAVVLAALGSAGQEPTLKHYFDYQLSKEVEKKCTKKENCSKTTGNFWWGAASFAGSVAAAVGLSQIQYWSTTFQISSYIMGATSLVFFLGIWCYYSEEISSESPLTLIWRVIKVANKKRRLPYPCSKEGYYSDKNSNNSFYQSHNGEFHLLPRVPSCLLFLDKAAIIENKSDGERKKSNGGICTVEQVREVKSLYFIIPLGCMLFAYSLISASGNTYFVQQEIKLDPMVGDFEVSIISLIVLKSLVAATVRTIQSIKEPVKPTWSIAIGMFCSVLCVIAAWFVERLRLSLILKDPQKKKISLGIMILTPQFLLLGLMEAFAEDGIVTFVRSGFTFRASMKNFVEPCAELLLATEKCFSLLFAYCFGMLNNKSANPSHLDWYFLFLALLSFGFFSIYMCNLLTRPPNSFTTPPNEGTQTDDQEENGATASCVNQGQRLGRVKTI